MPQPADLAAIGEQVAVTLRQQIADMRALLGDVRAVSGRAHKELELALNDADRRLSQRPLAGASSEEEINAMFKNLRQAADRAGERLEERAQQRSGGARAGNVRERLRPLANAVLTLSLSGPVRRLASGLRNQSAAQISAMQNVMAAEHNQIAAFDHLFGQVDHLAARIELALPIVKAASKTAAAHLQEALGVMRRSTQEHADLGMDASSMRRLDGALHRHRFYEAQQRLLHRQSTDRRALQRVADARAEMSILEETMNEIHASEPLKQLQNAMLRVGLPIIATGPEGETLAAYVRPL